LSGREGHQSIVARPGDITAQESSQTSKKENQGNGRNAIKGGENTKGKLEEIEKRSMGNIWDEKMQLGVGKSRCCGPFVIAGETQRSTSDKPAKTVYQGTKSNAEGLGL